MDTLFKSFIYNFYEQPLDRQDHWFLCSIAYGYDQIVGATTKGA